MTHTSLSEKHILLIEDEDNLRESLTLNLQLENYQIKALDRGTDIIATLSQQHFDLIILDIMLPLLSGFDICKIIRNRGYTTPILLFSAKTESQDRALGLQSGADDYMVKPFELAELLFRIRRLTDKEEKPTGTNTQTYYKFAGNNYFYLNTLTAKTYNNTTVILSKKESLFLKMLLEHKNTIVSREKILHFIWGFNIYPATRTIDNFILKFRKLFEEKPSFPKYFIAKRGIGYMYQEI